MNIFIKYIVNLINSQKKVSEINCLKSKLKTLTKILSILVHSKQIVRIIFIDLYYEKFQFNHECLNI